MEHKNLLLEIAWKLPGKILHLYGEVDVREGGVSEDFDSVSHGTESSMSPAGACIKS